MSFHTIIKNILENVCQKFNKNELAYLAMTGKIENPLRDKIAFELHTNFNTQALVCREWKGPNENNRTDIAIIDKVTKEPKCLIELKAHSTPRYEKEYGKFMLNDLRKMRTKADENTELYYIFFNNAIETEGIIDESFSSSIKYSHLINKAISKQNSSDIAQTIETAWSRYIAENTLSINKIEKVKINCGEYYNWTISIITYIYGPIFKDELEGS